MSDYLNNKELDSELVIGVVCAVGTETGLVIDLLRERLGRVGYRVEVVKVSSHVIRQLVVRILGSTSVVLITPQRALLDEG